MVLDIDSYIRNFQVLPFLQPFHSPGASALSFWTTCPHVLLGMLGFEQPVSQGSRWY